MKLIPKLTLFTMLVTFCLVAQAQNSDRSRIKVKKADVFLDGRLFLQIPFRAGSYHVCLPGKSVPIFVAKIEEYSHPNERSMGNPDGLVKYFSIRVAGFDQAAEINFLGAVNRRQLTQVVLDFDLISGDELNQENARRFIEMTGTPYSEEKNRIQIIETH